MLFPDIEGRAPMAKGPTGVMRMEDVSIRRLLGVMTDALRAHRVDDFDRADGELGQILGVHNMKEEQILYPMSDQLAGGPEGRAALVRKMQAVRAS